MKIALFNFNEKLSISQEWNKTKLMELALGPFSLFLSGNQPICSMILG